MIPILVEIIGWVGALLVLGAYLLVSTGRLPGTSTTFQWMNGLGAAFFVVNTWWHGAMPSMVLNVIWSVVGFWGLLRMRRVR